MQIENMPDDRLSLKCQSRQETVQYHQQSCYAWKISYRYVNKLREPAKTVIHKNDSGYYFEGLSDVFYDSLITT